MSKQGYIFGRKRQYVDFVCNGCGCKDKVVTFSEKEIQAVKDKGATCFECLLKF